MIPSVYLVGGAGSGKSTFMAELLPLVGGELGPLTDLRTVSNAKGTPVTLRGHEQVAPCADDCGAVGLYIGCMREHFPGTDGLDRASSIAGEAWLDDGGASEYAYLLGEGATLATTRFLAALQRHTDLLLLHLTCPDEEVKADRFRRRGSNQASSFVVATVSRAANRAREAREQGWAVLDLDTTDDTAWDVALGVAAAHLLR